MNAKRPTIIKYNERPNRKIKQISPKDSLNKILNRCNNEFVISSYKIELADAKIDIFLLRQNQHLKAI